MLMRIKTGFYVAKLERLILTVAVESAVEKNENSDRSNEFDCVWQDKYSSNI